MGKVEGSELVNYNANTRGTRTGDCTARSISLAFNIDYSAARKALNDSAKTNPRWDYNSHSNCIKVIEELGGGKLNGNVERITVNAFADSHPSGTYIIWCSRDGISHKGNHLVTIIDGTVYDSWDSRKYFVKGYWTISSGISSKDLTNIEPYLKKTLFDDRNVEWYNKYTSDMFDAIINKNRKLKKLANQYEMNINLDLEIHKVQLINYTFRLTYSIDLSFSNAKIKPKIYEGKVVIAFKPTMKQEEIEPYFNETFYNKFYFFIHNVVDKVEDICEGNSLLGDAKVRENPLYLYNDYEVKCFNSLPYWAQQLATDFQIYPPSYGESSDRVQLSINRLPNDPDWDIGPEFPIRTGAPSKRIRFYAPSMDALRKGLDYYKRTGDFDSAYEIAYTY